MMKLTEFPNMQASDLQFHLHRARMERDIAYRSADADAADIHMQLSALHLGRALLLQEVRRAPVGNVLPFQQRADDVRRAGASATWATLIELPANVLPIEANAPD